MIRKSLTKNFVFVWEKDPALDKEHEGFAEAWAAYEESLDPAVLPVVTGETLAKFVCQPLSMGGYGRMMSEPSEFNRCIEAVRYSLKSMSGYSIDGIEIKIEEGDKQKDGLDHRLKDSFLNKIWDPMLFVALGLAIIKSSVLDPTRAVG